MVRDGHELYIRNFVLDHKFNGVDHAFGGWCSLFNRQCTCDRLARIRRNKSFAVIPIFVPCKSRVFKMSRTAFWKHVVLLLSCGDTSAHHSTSGCLTNAVTWNLISISDWNQCDSRASQFQSRFLMDTCIQTMPDSMALAFSSSVPPSDSAEKIVNREATRG